MLIPQDLGIGGAHFHGRVRGRCEDRGLFLRDGGHGVRFFYFHESGINVLGGKCFDPRLGNDIDRKCSSSIVLASRGGRQPDRGSWTRIGHANGWRRPNRFLARDLPSSPELAS